MKTISLKLVDISFGIQHIYIVCYFSFISPQTMLWGYTINSYTRACISINAVDLLELDDRMLKYTVKSIVHQV